MRTDLSIKSNDYPFLAGGGEMGALIRSFDWSQTPLGAPNTWPQSLKTCIRIILTSRQPMFVWWGPELINIYNDAYIDIVRGKHPQALGQPAAVVWREIWDQVGPRANTVMTRNEGTYDEALLLIMERNGYPEETYYTFSYSPVPGDNGGTAGIICANTDDTERIIGARQLRTLRDLGKNIIDCKSNAEVFKKTIQVLSENPQDFPFAFIYELDANGADVQMVSFAGTDHIPDDVPARMNIVTNQEFPSFHRAMTTGKPQMVKGLGERFKALPRGAWSIPPDQALVLPIAQPGQNPFGFLNVGLSPYRQADEKYTSFFQLIADQLATALNNVHTYEQERRRAEALAEIDRAKTTFFSNISHEFRTPLTLMVSPLQELKAAAGLNQETREHIEVAYRNTLRLQKLVNSLLDFSRLEAGRLQARFEPVDLATLTSDLASSFRSAVEKAGMNLTVDCDRIEHPVYVDVDMWEKIVLNLVSNAFKYTHEGSITITLREENGRAQLTVRDTGIGIAQEEQDKIFERFHRIHNTRGRSQEGTGIGLALVLELVRMHDGNIQLESTPGKGSAFTVSIPTGKAHLPEEKIIERSDYTPLAERMDAYVEEAIKWLPEAPQEETAQEPLPAATIQTGSTTRRVSILLADDNADMRAYLKRLLSIQYDVRAVENGSLALRTIREQPPDLVLSDVMMPGIDGFELVRQLKAHPSTAQIPIILLSARAGEEATIEGLQTGADDYLVKPFSAKELLSRISSNVRIAQMRNYVSQQLQSVFMQAPVAIGILRGPQMIIELANESLLRIWGRTADVIGLPILEALPELEGTPYPGLLQKVYETGIIHAANEDSLYLDRERGRELVYFNFVYQPMYEMDGTISGVLASAIEITNQVNNRKQIEYAEERLRMAAEGTGLATWDLNLKTGEIIYTPRLNELFGYERTHVLTQADMRAHMHPDDREQIVEKAFEEAMRTGTYYYESRVILKNGTIRWLRTHGKVFHDEEGKPARILGTMVDITAGKEADMKLRESEERYRQLAQELEMRVEERTKDLSEANSNLARSNTELEQFAFVTSHDLQEPLRKIQTFGNMLHDNYAGELKDKGRSYLNKMLSASQRMSKLISDLLNFSRLRQTDEGFASVNLNEVLNNIQSDFELVIKQKNASIYHETLPVIDANPLQMNQLFYNLISNALKFTRDDVPPVIRIDCARVDQETLDKLPSLNKKKQYYELIFSDNGIGFAQEYARKIFEIFQRLNARAEYEGTGIGLALVKKIIENHRGLVFAESAEGFGSAFHIILPEKQLSAIS